jgi:hypothetical protein
MRTNTDILKLVSVLIVLVPIVCRSSYAVVRETPHTFPQAPIAYLATSFAPHNREYQNMIDEYKY